MQTYEQQARAQLQSSLVELYATFTSGQRKKSLVQALLLCSQGALTMVSVFTATGHCVKYLHSSLKVTVSNTVALQPHCLKAHSPTQTLLLKEQEQLKLTRA